MTGRDQIDWSAVEADFRADILSNRQIAKRRAVSESAIRKRAKEHGWAKEARVRVRTPEVTMPRPQRAPQDIEASSIAARSRDMANRLLNELDAVTTYLGELEEMITEETADDFNGRRRQAMLKAISLPSRTLTLKTLTQAVGALSEIEAAKGKKGLAADKAKDAATGRFAPPAPPKLVVDNK